jgi:hypothetical protein
MPVRRTSHRREALERLQVASRSVLQIRAVALRDTISSLLERHQVGRGEHYPGNRNPSSLPGDPPARQSGRLINSIQWNRVTDDVIEVGPNARAFTATGAYPVDLEYGNRRVAARPFMRPGVAEFKAKLR